MKQNKPIEIDTTLLVRVFALTVENFVHGDFCFYWRVTLKNKNILQIVRPSNKIHFTFQMLCSSNSTFSLLCNWKTDIFRWKTVCVFLSIANICFWPRNSLLGHDFMSKTYAHLEHYFDALHKMWINIDTTEIKIEKKPFTFNKHCHVNFT